MKLKNCKVGQKVVLKKNVTLNELSSCGCGDYELWVDWAKRVADELFAGGVVVIADVEDGVVLLEHNKDFLRLPPKFLKLVEKEHPKEEITAEGEIVKTVESQQCEIKPFMLVEVLDASGTWGKCEVGERLVVKEIEVGGLRALRSDENLKKGEDTNRKTVYLNNSGVKIINSNTGE